MSTTKSSPPSVSALIAVDPRRAALLEAALGVFARFGYRKTSMDEVARAAQFSRQGLYLHFTNKEELFRATLQHAITQSLEGARRALESEAALPERLSGAFDEWAGKYCGRFAADASDLMEAVETVGGTLLADHEKIFADVIAAAVKEGGLAAAYKSAGVTARQIAETLLSVSRGLKHSCETQEEYRQGFGVAVKIVCAPLVLR